MRDEDFLLPDRCAGDLGGSVLGARRTQEGAGGHAALPEVCCRENPFSGMWIHTYSPRKYTYQFPFWSYTGATILSISRRTIYIGSIIVAHILMLMFEDEKNWHFGSFSCVGDMMRVSITACPPKVAQICLADCVHLWTKGGDKQAADASRKDSSWLRGGNLQKCKYKSPSQQSQKHHDSEIKLKNSCLRSPVNK